MKFKNKSKNRKIEKQNYNRTINITGKNTFLVCFVILMDVIDRISISAL